MDKNILSSHMRIWFMVAMAFLISLWHKVRGIEGFALRAMSLHNHVSELQAWTYYVATESPPLMHQA